MNFKRVLAMLLALCLAVNMAVPGVSALTAGEGAYVPGQNPTASKMIAQGEPKRVTTLRDAVQAKPEQQSEGKWTAQPSSGRCRPDEGRAAPGRPGAPGGC